MEEQLQLPLGERAGPAKVVTKIQTGWQDQKEQGKTLENHYMNFTVTQEMPVPEGIPEKFVASGLQKKAQEPRDVARAARQDKHRRAGGENAGLVGQDLWVGFSNSGRWRWARCI